jgi:hypothetical protein
VYYSDLFNELELQIEAGRFTIHDDINIASWTIIEDTYDSESYEEMKGYPEFQGVEATLVIQRRIGYYVRFIFIPSIMLVTISFLSFFIDYTVAPARITIGVVPVLAQFNMMGRVATSLPRFSYTAWLPTFLFLNAIWNVAAMIEYVFISYIHNKATIAKANAEAKTRRNGNDKSGNYQECLTSRSENDSIQEEEAIRKEFERK